MIFTECVQIIIQYEENCVPGEALEIVLENFGIGLCGIRTHPWTSEPFYFISPTVLLPGHSSINCYLEFS